MFGMNKEHSAETFTGVDATTKLNKWLNNYKVKIIKMAQSGHGETLTITIIYTWD